MYNPYIGRFMQTDPIGYDDGMNWYTYCHSNPIFYSDPTGLCGIVTKPHSIGDNILLSAFLGDYAEDTGWTGVITQTAMGFVPIMGQIADARDTSAALKNWWRDPSWSTSARVAMAGVAWIPGAGDAAKGVTKASRKLTSESVQSVAKKADIDWIPSTSSREAFKAEDVRIQADGGVMNPENYNIINSPGRKYNIEDGGQ